MSAHEGLPNLQDLPTRLQQQRALSLDAGKHIRHLIRAKISAELDSHGGICLTQAPHLPLEHVIHDERERKRMATQ